MASVPSRQERRNGYRIFLAVTILWTVWCGYSLVALEDVLPPWGVGIGGVFVVRASAASLVVTGYLIGKDSSLIWLGLIPAGVMTVIGVIGMNTDLIFLTWYGVALLVCWPFYFVPLLGLGAYLRSRRPRRAAANSFEPTPQPRLHV